MSRMSPSLHTAVYYEKRDSGGDEYGDLRFVNDNQD